MTYKILLFISFYNIIFPIRLNHIPFFNYLLILVILLIFFIKKESINNLFSKDLLILIFLPLLLTLFSGISFIYNNSSDYLPIFQSIKFIFMIVTITVMIKLFISTFKEKSTLIIMKTIIYAGLIVSVTCTVEFFSESFKALLFSVIDTSGNIDYNESFRVHGFASSGGASLSVGLFISSLVSYILYKTSSEIKYYIIFIFIIISTVFIGRTGMVLGLLFLIYVTIIDIKPKSFFIVSLSILFSIYLFDFYLAEEYTNIIYGYSFEFLKNYIENGELSSKTTTAVSNMYYFPEWQHLLLGAGYWRYPTHGYSLSDVGYLKMIMAYGIIGALIFYFACAYIFFKAYRYYVNKYNIKLTFFVLFFVLYITELKEEFFMQNYSIKIILILVILSILIRKERKKIYE